MNMALKHALVDHYEPAYRVAMRMGICDVRLSKIVRGLAVPRKSEKQQLAAILCKPEHELFPESAEAINEES